MTDWKRGKKPEEIIPFVDGWDFVDILGEGAFGEVRLVVNSAHNIAAATKIVNLDKLSEDTIAAIEKEVKLHKFLHHKNIIRYYSHRYHAPWNSHLIFMEYASGGELFDKLKPDVGLPENEAQYYFKQLLEGLTYMHRKGFAHRDIKPENLLLTEDRRLKIIDFGHATTSRSRGNGQLKVMEKICGTPPYMAPEIWRKQGYFGPNVDVWSCGVVLIAMLSGELPWSQATADDEHYKLWCNGETLQMPWNNVSLDVIRLSKRILEDNPTKRITLEELMTCDWLLKKKVTDEAFSTSSSKRIKLSVNSGYAGSFSQPANLIEQELPEENEQDPHLNLLVPRNKAPSTSQPMTSEMMQFASQSQTQKYSQDMLLRMPRKYTRFCLDKSKIPRQKLIDSLSNLLEDFQTSTTTGIIRFDENVSIRPLVITAKIYNMVRSTSEFFVVDFERTRGDCIRFRKTFRVIKRWAVNSGYEVPLHRNDIIQMTCEKMEENKNIEKNKENLQGNSQPMLTAEELRESED